MSWACYPGMQWLPAATMAVRRRGLEGGGGWQLGTLQPPDSTLQAQQHGFQKAIWKLCTAVPLGACERYCGPRHPSRLARGGGEPSAQVLADNTPPGLGCIRGTAARLRRTGEYAQDAPRIGLCRARPLSCHHRPPARMYSA